MLDKIVHFFHHDLWQHPSASNTPRYKIECLKFLQIFTLAIRHFTKDNATLRASALTLYTLLSIVPVIAMLFGIAKGFGFESMLEDYLLEKVQDNDTMVLKLIEMSKNMLQSTQGGIVAGFGIVILFWTVIKVISNIEESFNHIWKIEKSRPIARKLSDYLSLMLFAPVLMIASNSINVMVQVKLTEMLNAVALPGTIFALQLLSYLPIIILWGLFSFIFIFMPNTNVKYQSGIFAGVISGTIYYFAQDLYVTLQIGASNYNAIYGSFAALPLFLIWLQIAWVIVLLGAELCYFHQNISRHQCNISDDALNFDSKKTLTLTIMHHIINRFNKLNTTAYTAETLSLKHNIPLNLVESRLTHLVACQLLTCIKDTNGNIPHYQPANDSNLLTDIYIITTLEQYGEYFNPKISALNA